MNVRTWGIRLILGCLVVGTAGTGWAYEPYKERKYPIKLTGKTVVSAVSGQKGLKTKVLEPGGDHRALWIFDYFFVGDGVWGPRKIKLMSLQMNTHLSAPQIEFSIANTKSFERSARLGISSEINTFIYGIQVCTSKANKTVQQMRVWSRNYDDAKPMTFSGLRTQVTSPREPCNWQIRTMCDDKSVGTGLTAHYNKESEGFIGFQLRCRKFKHK